MKLYYLCSAAVFVLGLVCNGQTDNPGQMNALSQAYIGICMQPRCRLARYLEQRIRIQICKPLRYIEYTMHLVCSYSTYHLSFFGVTFKVFSIAIYLYVATFVPMQMLQLLLPQLQWLLPWVMLMQLSIVLLKIPSSSDGK